MMAQEGDWTDCEPFAYTPRLLSVLVSWEEEVNPRSKLGSRGTATPETTSWLSATCTVGISVGEQEWRGEEGTKPPSERETECLS